VDATRDGQAIKAKAPTPRLAAWAMGLKTAGKMTRQGVVAILLLTAISAVAGADEAEEIPGEALLQGLWRFEAYRENGKSRLDGLVRGFAFQVSGNALGIKIRHAEDGYRDWPILPSNLTIRVDATTTPKQFDLMWDDKGAARKSLLVYSLDEDTLILCGTVGEYYKTRPKKIPKTIEEEEGFAVGVLKRMPVTDKGEEPTSE